MSGQQQQSSSRGIVRQFSRGSASHTSGRNGGRGRNNSQSNIEVTEATAATAQAAPIPQGAPAKMSYARAALNTAAGQTAPETTTSATGNGTSVSGVDMPNKTCFSSLHTDESGFSFGDFEHVRPGTVADRTAPKPTEPRRDADKGPIPFSQPDRPATQPRVANGSVPPAAAAAGPRPQYPAGGRGRGSFRGTDSGPAGPPGLPFSTPTMGAYGVPPQQPGVAMATAVPMGRGMPVAGGYAGGHSPGSLSPPQQGTFPPAYGAGAYYHQMAPMYNPYAPQRAGAVTPDGMPGGAQTRVYPPKPSDERVVAGTFVLPPRENRAIKIVRPNAKPAEEEKKAAGEEKMADDKKAAEEAAARKQEADDKKAAEEAVARKQEADDKKAAEEAAAKKHEADDKKAAEEAAAKKQEADDKKAAEEAAAKKQEADDKKAAEEAAAAAKEQPVVEVAAPADESSPTDKATSKKDKRKEALKRDGPSDSDPFAPKPPTPPTPSVAPPPVPVRAEAAEAAKDQSAVPDNWDGNRVPEPPAAPPAPVVPDGRKIYSRDYLLRLSDANTSMPAGLEPSTAPDVAALFDRSGGRDDSGFGHRGPGRQHSGRGFDRDGGRGGYGGQEWNRLPRGNSQPPGLPPGMPPMGGRGPPPSRGNSGKGGDDRWGQRGPLPPARGPGGDTWGHNNFEPQPKLHKTANSYKVGVLKSDNPELEKKAKEIQALLNKLTADNFTRIQEKLLEIGYKDNPQALETLVDKLFDKALTETTFSEVYAQLAARLVEAFARMPDKVGENTPAQFRRMLVNKCQQEFEAGLEHGAVPATLASDDDDKEEGELPAPSTEEEKLQAQRKRVLGNCQFVGQLFQHKQITVKITTSICSMLLAEEEEPRPIVLECLCKFLPQVGRLLEAQRDTKIPAPNGRTMSGKEVMIGYMARVQRLVDHKVKDTRLRFMLMDLLDMQRNGWQERMKKEGPRKISDLHAEVARKKMEQDRREAMDRMSSNRFDRGDSFRRGGAPAPRPRMDDRMDGPMRPVSKVPSTDNLTLGPSLRPGGGFGRGGVPGRAPSPATGSAAPRSRPASQTSIRGADSVPQPATPTAESEVASLVVERKAVNQCVTLLEQVKALRSTPSDRLSPEEADRIQQSGNNDVLVELSLTVKEYGPLQVACAALEAAKTARGFRSDELQATLQQLLALAAAPCPDLPDKPGTEPVLPASALAQALPWAMHQVGSWVEDKPVMAQLVGAVAGAAVAREDVPLVDVLRALAAAAAASAEQDEEEEGDDPPLIDDGTAWNVVAATLRALAQGEGGEVAAKSIWGGAVGEGLTATQFMATFVREDANEVAKEFTKAGLAWLQ